jgi:prepilin-type N-terminal cleavage/methylation domain-containing protein
VTIGWHPQPRPLSRKRERGFTLIELLVVLAILALLLTIAAPRYIDHVGRARDTALRTDLKVMREAIDKFDGDQGRLPASLDELVARRYLKEIPVDPITDKRDTWIVVTSAEMEQALAESGQSVSTTAATAGTKDATTPRIDVNRDALADIHSGAEGKAKDGTTYRDW